MHQSEGAFDEILRRSGVAPKLIGKRVFLAPYGGELSELTARWNTDDSVSDGLGNTPKLHTAKLGREYLDDLARDPRSCHLAIWDLRDCVPIGTCRLVDIDHLHRSSEMGISVGERPYRKGGRGTEAAALLLDYGFRALGLHSVWLRVFDFNEPAIAMYRRLGFRECGRLKESHFHDGGFHDTLLMELLEGDWRFPL